MEPGGLKEYVEAHEKRDSKGRLYIRTLNGDIPKGLEDEKEHIERIVKRWVNGQQFFQEDLDRLNSTSGFRYERIKPDLSVSKIWQRGKHRKASIAYREIYEAIVQWDNGRKDRVRPRQCQECGKWFVPAPKGRVGIYCSRVCDLAASNQRNAPSIKAKVKEGRLRGEYGYVRRKKR